MSGWKAIGLAALLLPAGCAAPESDAPQPAEPLEFEERTIDPESIGGVRDLEGNPTNPLLAPGSTATVLCFASTSCPTSNRYAPTVNAIHEEFSSRGIAFYLVYSDPSVSDDRIRKHLSDYGYPIPAVRDGRHELARATAARITPQVAVILPDQRLVYSGRIDNWYIALGKPRTVVTEHNLRDVLRAVIEERPVPQATGKPVGCYIPRH